MLELYQSEDCPDCARVRARLAELGAAYVVRTVPIDRARRERVLEAGGRADIPLLLDPERGRTTYDADEIVLVLGAEDFFPPDESPEKGLPRLFQRDGDPASAAARRALGEAGLDYVCVNAAAPAQDVPRVVEEGGAAFVGVDAIRRWAGRKPLPEEGEVGASGASSG